jgi:hypothetical protein
LLLAQLSGAVALFSFAFVMHLNVIPSHCGLSQQVSVL